MLALHRRLAPWLAGATVLSAAAFLALPWLAPQGSPAVFVAVTLLWTATSSALRAPPLNLIGRHAAKPAQPGLVALAMLGLGLAAAVASWLALWLKVPTRAGPSCAPAPAWCWRRWRWPGPSAMRRRAPWR
ncbi:MAG: hypothetical protein IPJ42_05135 [Betaproteobacteria bacterium]|nr:hypothetical protein [Betaproteobacteria bacterium]